MNPLPMFTLMVRFFLLLAWFASASISVAGETTRPNFIFVLIDDMGWGDFSCFGNKDVETPNVDRLANQGIRFTQFYVNSPICSPSRTALTTGQYPQRWRITSFLNNRAANRERGMAQWLDPKAVTLAGMLKREGYATGHFGKWHMGGQRDVGEAPLITEYGFDESLTQFEGLGPRLLPLGYANDGMPPLKHALGSDNLGHGPVVWVDRAKVTDMFVGAAVTFMRNALARKQPFYVNVWPDDVHSPFFPPGDRRGDGSKRALYHGVLKTLDEQLGALFDFVRTNPPLRDNTIIMVCSDNGPEPGAGSAGPFRGNKATLYEGGVRSPLIVWAPGKMATEKLGSKNETSVFSSVDLVPSMLTLAGVNTQSNRVDGEDLSTALLGKTTVSRKQPLYWSRPPDRPGPRNQPFPDLAVRDGDWKLLCRFDGSKPLLFNLAKDREETTNLAEQNVEIVQRLTASVRSWYEATLGSHSKD